MFKSATGYKQINSVVTFLQVCVDRVRDVKYMYFMSLNKTKKQTLHGIRKIE